MERVAALAWDIVRASVFLLATAAVLATAARAACCTATAAVDRLLITVVYSLSLAAAIVGCSAALGLFSPASIVLLAAAAYLAGQHLIKESTSVRRDRWRRVLRFVHMPAVVMGTAALALMLPALVRAPASWDAMTYHLYFPARWIQEGAIHHIPTVFGDNAAAFAPQNGALLHAWSMSLLGSDALTNTLSGVAIFAAMVALWSLSRSLGARAGPAAWVVGWTILLPPVMRESVSATVDALTWSMWLMSFALAMRYVAVRKQGLLAVSGLALGFAAGTKTIAVPLAVMLGAGIMALLLTRREWRALALYCGCAAFAGGSWFLRNQLLYENPLFPLDVRLGPLTLSGAYNTEAIRAGEFHLSGVMAVLQHLLRWWTWPTLALALLGLVFLAGFCASSLATRDARRAWPRGMVAGVAVSWFAYYLFVVPHNMETRFAVPALLLSLCGWAVLVSRLQQSFPHAARALLTLLTLPLLPAYVLHLRDTYQALRVDSVLVLIGVAVAVSALVWAARRSPRIGTPGLRRAAGPASAVALVVVSVHASEASRFAEYRREAGAVFTPGYLYFVNADLPPATIVYTGFNVPYTLVGPRLRHRVVYCNVSGAVGDGFYEFWRRDPRLHRYHRPPIYREDPRFDVWMDCVRRVSANYIAVFALHPGERSNLPSDAEGFPIEREWIHSHPELFAPVRRSAGTEIYAVRSRSARTEHHVDPR